MEHSSPAKSSKPPTLPFSPSSTRTDQSESELSSSMRVLQSFLLSAQFQQLRPHARYSLESAVFTVKQYLDTIAATPRVVSPSVRQSIHQRYISSPRSSRTNSPRLRSPTGEQRSYQVSKILRRIRRSNNLDERLDLVLIFRRANRAWLMQWRLAWERWAGCLFWSPAPYLMFTGAERIPSREEHSLPPPILQKRRHSPKKVETSLHSALVLGVRACVHSRKERLQQSFLHWRALTLMSLSMVPWVRTQAVATCQSGNCIAAYYAIRQAVSTIRTIGRRRVKQAWKAWQRRTQMVRQAGGRTANSLSRVRESHLWMKNLRKSAS